MSAERAQQTAPIALPQVILLTPVLLSGVTLQLPSWGRHLSGTKVSLCEQDGAGGGSHSINSKLLAVPDGTGEWVELTECQVLSENGTECSEFDIYAWMPNGPSTMRKPPPTTKGTTTYQRILETLPVINTTATAMVAVSLLSKEPHDRNPLGKYRNNQFVEDVPKKCIERFREKLSEISQQIKQRNKTKRLTYHYLDPEEIECSVSI
ncbi:hydroperoxide isomerase ALOXE3-like isoform X1 [Xenopus tropicalis]|uniref:Hydroperoxide isomerase ALOXE3-like isoform X1 n=1 Tax=Xenopus tropicalis TaxID=8364 RepID=A0A8J1J9F9_XENTR|nr:hydroperoxide isomerase ALOXE3-like isoform X1 [Xenopus tropicalis]